MFVAENEDNLIQNLEYELKEIKLKYELLKYNSHKKMKELEERNKILSSKLLLKDKKTLIEESNKDTTELYIQYLEKEILMSKVLL